MAVSRRHRLVEALLSACSLEPGQDKMLLLEQKRLNKPLASLLLEKKLITESTVLDLLEDHLQLKRIDLYDYEVCPESTALVTPDIALRFQILPVGKDAENLYLAMADPLDLDAIDYISRLTGMTIVPLIAGPLAVADAINRHYYLTADSLEIGKVLLERESDVAASSGQAPVVKAVHALIRKAIDEKASDIHLEPSSNGLRVRMRIDGILNDLPSFPADKQAQIISRVKVMASLDIAEKRLSQDGYINLGNRDAAVNLRVSTLPTVEGEKIVIRLLEEERIILPLEKLGLSRPNYVSFQKLLLNQSGMLLVTGPTGCGKTTTLYSALSYLNSPEDNIITVEDPVEYRLKGINQVQVNRRINRTFANALRFILRQDPNIIMVGEIRDLETAKIAVQAALTGHLVLSTLHTNNAAGAITRLVDMGLERYMVQASVAGVVAMRLIRKVCESCREEYRPGPEERNFFQRYFGKRAPERLQRGLGCRRCNQSGYRGRTSIQELLLINRDIQDLILSGAGSSAIQAKAVEQGMQPLVGDGLRALLEGITTVNEVVRNTFNSVLDNDVLSYRESSEFISHLQRSRSR